MSAQAFDNLNLLLQLMQATRNLATGFRRVASDNLAMAQAVPPTVALADLQSNIANLGNSVQNTLSTARAWVQANNAQATAAVGLIGATLGDLNTYVSPIQTAATNLQAADISTYAACITALQAVLSTVPAPNTVFGT
jgi:hypothetical protein